MADMKFPPVGRCIYCDADGGTTELTDEHVIPLALNGHYVLQKASCKQCAKATRKVERFCLREMLIEARVHLDMRTRRPKDRATTLPVYEEHPDGQQRHEVPVQDHPLVIRLPRLARAPFLEGKKGDEWVSHLVPPFWTFSGYHERAADTFKQLAARGKIRTDFSYAPTLFCLMLAKIAHGAAVLHKGYGSFETFLGRLISEGSTEVHEYVGGHPNPTIVHRETPFAVRIKNRSDYITVELCMFADLGAPVYEVVVGRPL